MSNKEVRVMTQQELLNLPQAEWEKEDDYESLVIVPTKRLHDSGWRLMAIIGCKQIENEHNVPVCIVGYCDDLNLIFNTFIDRYNSRVQLDMTIRNCIRLHSNGYYFRIGHCCSSSDVKLIPKI